MPCTGRKYVRKRNISSPLQLLRYYSYEKASGSISENCKLSIGCFVNEQVFEYLVELLDEKKETESYRFKEF